MPGPGNVGERVRNLRLTRRLSQAQLAGHDLSDSYISLIESGKRTPTPTVLRMLAERLGCTPEYLAEGVEPEQRAHLEVRERHAHLALLAGDPRGAASVFEDVIKRSDDPDLTARAREGQAHALEQLGRVEDAIALFEELREQAERDPGRTSWLPPVISLARCYHAVGDLGQAIALGERTFARLDELGLARGHERIEVGRMLLLAYVDRSDFARAHALGRTLLAAEEAGRTGDGDTLSVCYQQASVRALDQNAIGDSLYFADQALAARGEGTRPRALARLDLAAAKALLRGVPAFSVETPVPEDMPLGASPGAAEEALRLLEGAEDLEGAEVTERTVEKARALVILGRPAQAISGLEEFLETGMALAAPTEDSLTTLGPPPGTDLVARTHKMAQARLVLARARVAQHDPQAALVVLRAAATQLAELPANRSTARLLHELGDLFQIAGDTLAATTAYRQSLEAAGLRAGRPHTAPCDIGV
ncbi:helix-turn-helix domain-containing protein [Actinomadura rupiterrae]|uniref:helix-turn-helix domain-containing protein n=1 Tax=Actinomadura rupiterrae TaxID=559627 RepID=UPI0020A3E5A8|nr:helix-turn-helix domain-containing protein [Actinomadura rupiterrae]MCP2340486.1 transcriptional regulator with XRE-family HTH domain [Actinomadura rupiterrae]